MMTEDATPGAGGDAGAPGPEGEAGADAGGEAGGADGGNEGAGGDPEITDAPEPDPVKPVERAEPIKIRAEVKRDLLCPECGTLLLCMDQGSGGMMCPHRPCKLHGVRFAAKKSTVELVEIVKK